MSMGDKVYASWGSDKSFKYKWQAKVQDKIFAVKMWFKKLKES